MELLKLGFVHIGERDAAGVFAVCTVRQLDGVVVASLHDQPGLSLRCEKLDISLAQVIKRRRDRVVSPWLIHHVTSSGNVKASDQVGENSLSVSFKLAIDSTGLSVEHGKTIPTFHEQRSLSERLYEEQGINTQQLLGHSSDRMTAQYHNDRGLDWVKVKV